MSYAMESNDGGILRSSNAETAYQLPELQWAEHRAEAETYLPPLEMCA